MIHKCVLARQDGGQTRSTHRHNNAVTGWQRRRVPKSVTPLLSRHECVLARLVMTSTLVPMPTTASTAIGGCQGDGRGRLEPSRADCLHCCDHDLCHDDPGHAIGKVSTVPTTNEQLQRARERTESPSYPGECLSRQELAELVNAHIWRHHDKTVEIDANYVGKLERGIIRWPSALYREALRSVLGVSTDASLGFTNRRHKVVKLEDVDRKQFLRTTALGVGALALAPVTALLEGAERTAVPTRVGQTEIEQTRTAARVFASWDHTYGGGLAREAVYAQLRYSAGLLEATVPARLRAELFGAVGDLADVAAFSAFDACAHDEAKRLFRFALACAEESENWQLRAEILADMTRQAIYLGESDEGLTYSDYALVRTDRLTRTGRAMLHTVRAHALANMRRVRDTLFAVGTADEHFAHANPANDPPWMNYYDTAQHAGETGHALADLAPAGHGTAEAGQRLYTAISGHDSAYVRSKVRSEVKLASLTMLAGDPTEAAAVGAAALDHADSLRSPRTLTLLRELRQRIAPHKANGEIDHLRQRIDHVLLAS